MAERPLEALTADERRMVLDIRRLEGDLPLFRTSWHDVTLLVARMSCVIDYLVEALAAARTNRSDATLRK